MALPSYEELMKGKEESSSLPSYDELIKGSAPGGTFEPDVQTLPDGRTFTPDAPKQYAGVKQKLPGDEISEADAFLAGTAEGAATKSGAALMASKVTGASKEEYKQFSEQAFEDSPASFALGQMTGFFAGLPSKLFKGAEAAYVGARTLPRALTAGAKATMYGKQAAPAVAKALTRGAKMSYVGKTTAGFLGGEATLAGAESLLENVGSDVSASDRVGMALEAGKDKMGKVASDPWSLLMMGAGEALPVARAVKGTYQMALNKAAQRGVKNLPPELQETFSGKNIKETIAISDAGPKAVVKKRTDAALAAVTRVKEKQIQIADALKQKVATQAQGAADEMTVIMDDAVNSIGDMADQLETAARMDAKVATKVAQKGIFSIATQIEALDDTKRAWANAKYSPILEANKNTTVSLPGDLWSDFLDSGFVRVNAQNKLEIAKDALELVPHYNRERVGQAVGDLINQFNSAKLGNIGKTQVAEVIVPFKDALNLKKGVNALAGYGAKHVTGEAFGFRKLGERIQPKLYAADVSGKLKPTDLAFKEASDSIRELRQAVKGASGTGVAGAVQDLALDVPTKRGVALTKASMSMDNVFSAQLEQVVNDYTKAAQTRLALPKAIGGLRKQLVSQLKSGKPINAGSFQEYLDLHNKALLPDTFAQQLTKLNPNIPKNVPEVLKKAVAGSDDALKQLKDLGVSEKEVEALRTASKRMETYGNSSKQATTIIRDMASKGTISREQKEMLSLLSTEYPEVRKMVEGIEFAKKVDKASKAQDISYGLRTTIRHAAGALGGSLGYGTGGYLGAGVGAAAGYGTAEAVLTMLANPGKLAMHLYKTKAATNLAAASAKAADISNIFSRGLMALGSVKELPEGK